MTESVESSEKQITASDLNEKFEISNKNFKKIYSELEQLKESDKNLAQSQENQVNRAIETISDIATLLVKTFGKFESELHAIENQVKELQQKVKEFQQE